MRLFLSAGEASGDSFGAALVEAVGPGFAWEAVGGPKLRAAGAVIVADSTRWGAIGIAQAYRLAPRLIRGHFQAKRALGGEPGLFVPIDFGYMNIRLARHAKNLGWRVLYFIPPGSWRRDRQGGDLPAVTDAIVTPFPWSAELLNGMGANAHFYGHPLKQMVVAAGVATTEGRETIAVLPGSRDDEVARNLPVIAEALAGRDEPVEFAVAPSIGADQLSAMWTRCAPGRAGDRFTEGDTYGVLKRAKAAVVCSGTATLEAALCRCPTVVMYRVGPLVELQARLIRLKVEHISQPNILLQRAVLPELIQHAATPAALRAALEPLLTDTPERQAQLQAFEELDTLLGPPDAITRTAELVRTMI